MTTPSPALDLRAVEALLAFWADAGVDACLGEVPVDRLAERPRKATAAPAPAAARAAPAPPPPEGSDRPARARALCAAAGDLEALRAAARDLFGPAAASLDLPASGQVRLMVVGAAPNAEDEAEGLPFRGRRGALLRALLAAAGLQDDVLYANTAFRRPPGGGDPSAALQAETAPFLERAAALTAPAAVLLLGGCAARAVARRTAPILKLRGSWFTWAPPGAPGPTPALVTLAPDFLLAHPSSKKAAWADILSLAARLAP